ncbi:MAG: hypothetical protein COA54_15670 [Thiotrichaceae bacterium]|nr:MAG: hypothetical protein COA54_15670 [Thiotrichaceae bacterium]
MAKPTTHGETPFRINLEQQKKRAKELLKAFHSDASTDKSSADKTAANNAALLRFKQHHPKFPPKLLENTLASVKLSDAQLVIARELGLPSWAKLKTHIAAMMRASDAIKTKALAPDAEFKTLHIRCGSDLSSTLPAGGFIGDFLEYSDPYGQGPIVQNDNFIKTRAKFLHESYDSLFEYKPDDSRADKTLSSTTAFLETADARLKLAAQQYERIVLWFEHDGYDQLILAKLLAYFAENAVPGKKQPGKAVPKKLELVSVNHFPGSARFIGLGQLPPEAIRLLWQQRQAVSQQQLKLGKQVWNALGESSPLPLFEITNSKNIKHLPNMGGALLRHLQELPSTRNGLSLTEHITLELLNEESKTAGQLFGQLMRIRDPLPWLGDIMYWFILQSMMQTSQAVFEISKDDLKKPWQHRLLTITDTGKKVLVGTHSWLSLDPTVRWLGGVKISAGNSCWHWDNKTERPILN